MTATLPARAEVPPEHTWDLASLYADQAAWEADAAHLEADLPKLTTFQGRLATAAALLEWMQSYNESAVRAWSLYSYASMGFDVDTTNQAAAGLRDRAIGLYTRFAAATAFSEPELLSLEPQQLAAFLAEEPELAVYQHYLDNLQRRKAHVRSGEVEQLLAQAGAPLSAAATAYQMLADGDLRFADAVDSAGTPHAVERGTAQEQLQQSDRTLRKSSWESIADGFLGFKNTLGAIYAGSVRGNVFRARARGYANVLDAQLDDPNVPRAVYENVIAACNRHLPIWHRYWDLRRKALGLEKLEPCDIFTPLVEAPPLEYNAAVEMICAGIAPLGEQYVSVSRAGLTSERWVDIYPNKGKTSGAYSGGSYRTKPFILMNYTNTLPSMSTLAHELGHSMHSWLTQRAQPPVYSNYSLFVAEVASNFNQALVRGHLLAQGGDRTFRISVIEEAMNNFHRYLFLMPILSQFEFAVHSWAEEGEPVTADRMNEHLADLFTQGYGPAMHVDRPRNGIVWAQFPHLYAPYYVFQYASGIAAANALADDVLKGKPGAVEGYLQFLATGSARYPLDALALAGIDMTSPEPLDRAFDVLAGFVDALEQLV
jgi:oligoendopeptidase F